MDETEDFPRPVKIEIDVADTTFCCGETEETQESGSGNGKDLSVQSPGTDVKDGSRIKQEVLWPAEVTGQRPQDGTSCPRDDSRTRVVVCRAHSEDPTIESYHPQPETSQDSSVHGETPHCKKRKLKVLSLEDKRKVLEDLDKKELSSAEICTKYSVTRSTLYTFKRDKAKIVDACSHYAPGRKRARSSDVDTRLEDRLFAWYRKVTGGGGVVSRAELTRKAEEYGKQFRLAEFTATFSWMSRFIRRRGIHLKSAKAQKNLECCDLAEEHQLESEREKAFSDNTKMQVNIPTAFRGVKDSANISTSEGVSKEMPSDAEDRETVQGPRLCSQSGDSDSDVDGETEVYPKRKLHTLTLETKVKILKEIDKKKMRNFEICKKYGIASSTLSTCIKNRASIRQAFSAFAPERKRARSSLVGDHLEASLFSWYKEATKNSSKVTRSDLTQKAQELGEDCGFSEFTPSWSWINRFVQRRGIDLKPSRGKKNMTDAQGGGNVSAEDCLQGETEPTDGFKIELDIADSSFCFDEARLVQDCSTNVRESLQDHGTDSDCQREESLLPQETVVTHTDGTIISASEDAVMKSHDTHDQKNVSQICYKQSTTSEESTENEATQAHSAKRNMLTFDTKAKILKEVDRKILKKVEISKKYGISSSTLSTLIKNRTKIENASTTFAPDRKKARQSSVGHKLEGSLMSWCKEAKERQIEVTRAVLMRKAEELREKFGLTEYMPTTSWMDRFIHRRGIKLKGAKGKTDLTHTPKDNFLESYFSDRDFPQVKTEWTEIDLDNVKTETDGPVCLNEPLQVLDNIKTETDGPVCLNELQQVLMSNTNDGENCQDDTFRKRFQGAAISQLEEAHTPLMASTLSKTETHISADEDSNMHKQETVSQLSHMQSSINQGSRANTVMPAGINRRNMLTFDNKMKVLEEVDQKILKRCEISKKYGIPPSTLSTFIKNRAQIEKASTAFAPDRKRATSSHAGDCLEERLFSWYKEVTERNVCVSRTQLTEKAQELGEKYGLNGFTPSYWWMSRFIQRRGIQPKQARRKKNCTERQSYAEDSVSAENFLQGDTNHAEYLPDSSTIELDSADSSLCFHKSQPVQDHGASGSEKWQDHCSDSVSLPEDSHVPQMSGTSVMKISSPCNQNRRKVFMSDADTRLDSKLISWCGIGEESRALITRPVLFKKALQLAKRLSLSRPTMPWLNQFVKRTGISLKARKQISAAADDCDQCADINRGDCWEDKFSSILQQFEHHNVFCAVETGLFYKCLPNQTTSHFGEQCGRGEKAADRFTVLLATNMDGSEKLPAVVIGQSPCPGNLKTLPMKYYRNSQSWLTSDRFEEWLISLNVKFREQNRRAVMYVDSGSGLPDIRLQHVRIVFFPSPSSIRQYHPFANGIRRHFKLGYRQIILNKLLASEGRIHVEDSIDSTFNFVFSWLDALYAIRMSWANVPRCVIASSFRCAGFGTVDKALTEAAQRELSTCVQTFSQTFAQMRLEGIEAEQYVDVDKDLCVVAWDDVSTTIESDAAAECGHDEDMQRPTPPGLSEVHKSLQTLLYCVSSNGGSDSLFDDLSRVGNFIHKNVKR